MALFLVVFLLVLALCMYWRFFLAVVLALLIAFAIVGAMSVGSTGTTPAGAVQNVQAPR